MGGPLDKWRVRGWLDDVEIELHPGPFDPEAARRSRTELTRMLEGLGYAPGVRRVLLEVHARLGGLPARGFPDEEPPSLLADLADDATLGRLVVRRIERPRVAGSAAPETEPKLRLLPEPPPQPQKSWIGIALVDQNGTPVPSRAYRIVGPDGTVFQGNLGADGTATLKDIDEGPYRISCPYVPSHDVVSYSVQEGDHTSGIAQNFGFDDYTTVWNDPGNADLQSERDNPHVLAAGDEVRVPALRELPVTKYAGDQYAFTIQISPLKLRLQMLDLLGNPITGSQVTVGDKPFTTDGNGLVEVPVDKTAQDVSAELSDDEQLDMALGALGPADDDSDAGWKARLYNLGYLWDPTVDDGDDEVVVALQDFQAQYGLPVSGQLDDATKAQLVRVYGA
jgi:hypothetical protein